jgi:hypothetical protein
MAELNLMTFLKRISILPAIGCFAGLAVGAELWEERTLVLDKLVEMPAGILSASELDQLIAQGLNLFTAKFTTRDGAGRPAATQAILPTKRRRPVKQQFQRTSGPDSSNCAACHNDPIVGGAGDFVTNVFAAEGFQNADFDTTDPQFSNERGTNHLFGAGLLELLAREMSADLVSLRQSALTQARVGGEAVTVTLTTKGVDFGSITAEPDGRVLLDKVEGVDPDLVVRPFSQKGVMTSLRQFTINALNHHHGMQSTERFGARWTASADHDEDGVEREILPAHVSALVAFQATLPPPQMTVPSQKSWRIAAAQGGTRFNDIGCAQCHRSELPLSSLVFADPGPLDASGTLAAQDVAMPAQYNLSLLDWAKALPKNSDGDYLVPLFGDLKRHVMTDNRIDALGNELLSQRFVERNAFITAELWGAGSTGPYGHRNDFTSLESIILAHGGDGRAARDAFDDLTATERGEIIAFLKTMEILP